LSAFLREIKEEKEEKEEEEEEYKVVILYYNITTLLHYYITTLLHYYSLLYNILLYLDAPCLVL
jgi:hypothetical protein